MVAISLAVSRLDIRMVVGPGEPRELAAHAWPTWIDHMGWKVVLGEFGKPAFEAHPEVHFNLAHTRGAAVVAVSDQPVGVDIEAIGRLDKRIVARHFTEREQQYVDFNTEGAPVRFTEIWTRKEAFVKWLGVGLRLPLRSFDTLADNRIRTRNVSGFVLSICAEVPDLPADWPVVNTSASDGIQT